jgi:protocatechuate 3,4-dioxygenase beta subunit
LISVLSKVKYSPIACFFRRIGVAFKQQQMGWMIVMRYALILVLAFSACLDVTQAQEPIVGLPCEGCDAVFDGMPAQIPSRARIGNPDEPGEALLLQGKVIDAKGKPASGVVIYAYQTNSKGIYPTSASGSAKRDRQTSTHSIARPAHRHGLLRAWASTDAQGRYAFQTIKPAGYPETDLPAHIHLHVLERGRCTYYIDDVMFKDDPRLTPEKIRALRLERGGSGIGLPMRNADGWQITRDIELGKNIPGYSGCSQ